MSGPLFSCFAIMSLANLVPIDRAGAYHGLAKFACARFMAATTMK
jgi:hypothetical protein